MLGNTNIMIKKDDISHIVLPSEYQRVQSLYSTDKTENSGPTIDTLIRPSNTMKIELLYSLDSISSPQQWGCFLLSRNSFGLRRNYDTAKLQMYVMGSEEIIEIDLENALTPGVHYLMIDLMNGIIEDGQGTSIDIPETNISSDALTMTMFRSLSGSDFHNPTEMKLFDLKIYKSNRLICHFVPCYLKSNNTNGLYDVIGENFYTNISTGTFTVGQNVY